jgi:DnaJ-class molecular chaperone
VYRRVGLHQDAPEWVVIAVRRAYRSRLHPDRHPARLKLDAERRFKEAEAVFDLIYSQRGIAQ